MFKPHRFSQQYKHVHAHICIQPPTHTSILHDKIENYFAEPGMVEHAGDPSSQEVEPGI